MATVTIPGPVTDIDSGVPKVAVLVVGDDDRVTAALANELRMYMEQALRVTTVPLANLVEAENYLDFDDIREEHKGDIVSTNRIIAEESETIWDGMCNSFPAIRRLAMTVGVEIIKGRVVLDKEIVQSALVQIGDEPVVNQRITTFHP